MMNVLRNFGKRGLTPFSKKTWSVPIPLIDLILLKTASKFLAILFVMAVFLFFQNEVFAAVAHDAASESHTGTTGSTGAALFTWTHTPVGTPRGVLVYVYTISATQTVTGVTYGGVAMTAVAGGAAVDTAGEPGRVDTFFLGASIPVGAQSVVVSRTNNATIMYASAATQTAGVDTEVYTPGIVLLQNNGTYAVQSVTDGSTGVNSVRYAAGYSGGANVLAAGAGSTILNSIDFGSYTATTARETTAGQGARNVGFTYATSDDRAAVHLAVRESPPTVTSIVPNTGPTAGGTSVTITGTNFTGATAVTIGGVAATGITVVNATTITATTPAGTAGAQDVVVTTPGGTGTGTGLFTYMAAPTVTSIAPNTGPTAGGTAVTITGTNFTGATVYTIGGASLTGVTVVNATTITGTTPAGTAGAQNVVVTTPGGTGTGTGLFTYVPPPTATTNPASGVTAWAATLNGTVSSNGADTTVSFDYGLTTAYGSSIAATPSPLGAGAVNTAVSAALAGLNCNTTFHYRVVATNSAGTTNGLDGTFTTLACGAPYPATACAATRFGNDLGCTANDVNITGITLAPTTTRTSCVSGTPVILDLDLTVNFAAPDRWDVGIFIANDGNLPTLLPANGGASSCSVDILPTPANIIPPPTRVPPISFYGDLFLDLDGAPQGTPDKCGDGNSSYTPTTVGTPIGSGIKRMYDVTLPCYANASSGGQLFVPFVVSWDNQKSPIGGLCTSNLDPVPNTTSKCNAPASSVSIAVVVLPVITKTNGGTEINPGANTAYTVVINNNSGGTLQDVVFKDPAVTTDPGVPGSNTLLTVNSVSCAAAGGATCPAMTSAQMITAMQGAGITIPSASIPNNSNLTFTINATLSAAATVGSHLINTASATVGVHPSTASDDDLIVLAPSAAMSFAPSTITEGSSSVLTVTLTNPTASAVTGVSFTDTYPAGLVNTAAAGGATTCGGTVTAANGGTSLALSGGTIPANGSCTVTVNVTSATAGSYNNSTGTVTTGSGTISAASATLTVNVPVYGGFNACDSAAAPNATCTNTTTITDSRITTKIAGSAFNLDIVALNSNGTRNTSYNSTVLVELLDASSGLPNDSYNCNSTWTVIATLAPNPSFSPANNGLITVGPFSVADAYRDVRVRVTKASAFTPKGCSTDRFAIRPNSLTVNPTDTDWQTAGTARALINTGASGGNVHKAGQPFTVTATAKNAASVTTANYAGTPVLTVTDCSPAGTACTANLGTFALGTATSFISGVLTSNLATYSEVGAFNLTLQDTDFASADAADTAASCAGYYVCGTASVGRFVPDHFDTVVVATATTPMPCPDGLTCPLLYDGFVYSGQAFSVQVTARNAAGAPTVNYDSTKALSKDVTLSAWDAVGGATANPGGGTLTFNTVLSTAFISGGVATTSTPVYTFPTTPVAPTDIYLRALDAESVTSLRAASVEGGVKIVSGRVKIGNAHGSELLDLPMTATVQYYNGTNWLTSLTDSVTSLTLGLSNYQCKTGCAWTTTPTPAGGPVISGILSFKLSKPTSGGTGSVDVSISAPNYLLAGSNGAAVNPSIAGRATFGVYKGNNEFIYLRETY